MFQKLWLMCILLYVYVVHALWWYLTKPESITLQEEEKNIDLKSIYKDYDNNLVYHPNTVKHKCSIAFLLKAFPPSYVNRYTFFQPLAGVLSIGKYWIVFVSHYYYCCWIVCVSCTLCYNRIHKIHSLKINELQNGMHIVQHDQWVIFITIKFIINGVLYVKYYIS